MGAAMHVQYDTNTDTDSVLKSKPVCHVSHFFGKKHTFTEQDGTRMRNEAGGNMRVPICIINQSEENNQGHTILHRIPKCLMLSLHMSHSIMLKSSVQIDQWETSFKDHCNTCNTPN